MTANSGGFDWAKNCYACYVGKPLNAGKGTHTMGTIEHPNGWQNSIEGLLCHMERVSKRFDHFNTGDSMPEERQETAARRSEGGEQCPLCINPTGECAYRAGFRDGTAMWGLCEACCNRWDGAAKRPEATQHMSPALSHPEGQEVTLPALKQPYEKPTDERLRQIAESELDPDCDPMCGVCIGIIATRECLKLRSELAALRASAGSATEAVNNSRLTIEDMKKLCRAAFWCDKYVSHKTGEESLPHPSEAEAASAMIHEVLSSAGPSNSVDAAEYRKGLGASAGEGFEEWWRPTFGQPISHENYGAATKISRLSLARKAWTAARSSRQAIRKEVLQEALETATNVRTVMSIRGMGYDAAVEDVCSAILAKIAALGDEVKP